MSCVIQETNGAQIEEMWKMSRSGFVHSKITPVSHGTHHYSVRENQYCIVFDDTDPTVYDVIFGDRPYRSARIRRSPLDKHKEISNAFLWGQHRKDFKKMMKDTKKLKHWERKTTRINRWVQSKEVEVTYPHKIWWRERRQNFDDKMSGPDFPELVNIWNSSTASVVDLDLQFWLIAFFVSPSRSLLSD